MLAAVIAVPLGIAMGVYKPIEAFFEPFVSFARYLPASAFIPLLILWVGIGEAQKLTVIFIGCFFQLTLMITMIVSGTRRDLVEAAYTLGCKDTGVVRRVLLPGAAPEIAEALRQVLGLGWTYIIVAELIGASSGIGHMITDSQALMATDHIIAGIVVIGLVGPALGPAVQEGEPAPVLAGACCDEPALDPRRRPRSSPAHKRDAPPTQALLPVEPRRRRQRFHHRARPVGLRQVHPAAAGRRAGNADDGRDPARRHDRSRAPAPIAAWCSRATRCSPG